MTNLDQSDPLVFGRDATEGIVAVEHIAGEEGDRMLLFTRREKETAQAEDEFSPFIWLKSADLLNTCEVSAELKDLEGDNPLACLAVFKTWKDLQAASSYLKKKTGRSPTAPDAPYYYPNDPVLQYLMSTGRTCFKGMSFKSLKRMQVDIETFTEEGFDFPNAQRKGDRIIAIALADETGWSEVLSGEELDEKGLLEAFVERVCERDPDVIEGHNLFKFDLPYIITRAKRQKVKLKLGRDGSVPKTRSSRFYAAERSTTYPRTEIFGRHVIDTYFLVQIYDVSHRSLEGFGLKDVARHFGVAAPDRTYLEGHEIASLFRKKPAKVMDYARDDILETRSLGDLLTPIYFAQAQLLPYSYQNVAVRGNAAKIDALLLREYLRQGHSVATPDARKQFAGGYTDIFFEGVAENVHHCDIRSLYPSLMLTQEIEPGSDDLGVFLKLLDYLKSFRIDAKEKMQKASKEDSVYLDALQTTFKVLINSFYGYLGFSQARFNDFDMAEKIAAEGRDVLKSMIEWLNEHGAKPIEIDTDGIYFVPPDFSKKSELAEFRESFQSSLPKGIEVEFDGEYPAMFSYKMKNYALLCDNGEIIIKGAALKSRGLEPFQREFLRGMLEHILREEPEKIEDMKQEYAEAIREGRWPIQKLAKTEQLQDSPATYAAKIEAKGRGRSAAYELALNSDREYQAGDQVSYYVTGNKKSVAVHSAAKLVSEWDPENRDENVPYYLAKLESLARKFGDMRQGELDM